MPKETDAWGRLEAVVAHLRLVSLSVFGVVVLGLGLAESNWQMIGAGIALLGLVALIFMIDRPSSHRGDDSQ